MATPPDFTTGSVLTAAQMNAVGLWRITGCTVSSAGGTAATASDGVITFGAGNTSVTISNAFSADYANYLILIDYAYAGTGNPSMLMTMGATATGYYGVNAYYAYDASGDGTAKRNAGVDWPIGYVGANNFSAAVTVYAPQRAVRTSVSSTYAGDLYYGTFNGMLANTTQYTSFTLAPSSSSFTTGTVRVYGYNA